MIGHQRAADTAVLGPTVHIRVEEGAVDDQLAPTFKEVKQADGALRPFELIVLFYRRPRQPPSQCGQRVTRPGVFLLLDEHLLARSIPLLRRHNRNVFMKSPFADHRRIIQHFS